MTNTVSNSEIKQKIICLLRKSSLATVVRKARDAREFLSDYTFYSKFNTFGGGGKKIPPNSNYCCTRMSLKKACAPI